MSPPSFTLYGGRGTSSHTWSWFMRCLMLFSISDTIYRWLETVLDVSWKKQQCPPWSKDIYWGEKCKLWPTLCAVVFQSWHWMRQKFGYFILFFMISKGENTLFFKKCSKNSLVPVKKLTLFASKVDTQYHFKFRYQI